MAEFTASNGVKVYRNSQGFLEAKSVEGPTDFLYTDHEVAFREYFAQEPKAWENAAEGEVWVLTVDESIEVPCRVDGDGDFIAIDPHPAGAVFMKDNKRITTGRRIWPEGDQS